MSKAKVTPITPAGQGEPRTIPLSDISIAWPRRNDFEGDDERAPVVLTGKHLAQHLAWLARTRPGCLGISPDRDVFDETSVHLQLTGFSEVLRALGYANTVDAQTDFAAVFAFLAEASEMMVAELTAENDARLKLKKATVTIGAPATEPAR
jgi:hypothetical protein